MQLGSVHMAEAKAQRVPEFDFTKGVLVLFMVLYHWLNYFIGLDGDIYKYLMFLTPSFIFITGFLISHVSISKYTADPSKLSKRLAIRGLKLLVIFVALNIAIALLFPGSSIRTATFSHLSPETINDIFVEGRAAAGSGAGKLASFTILVPIGYLLIVSALLLNWVKAFRYVFHAACAVALVAALVLNVLGVPNGILELLSIGLLGVVFGYAPDVKIAKLSSRAYLIVFAYAAYVAAITVLAVPFALRIVGVCLTLALIYIIGARLTGPLREHVLTLGRYSLLAYILQIAILQILHKTANHLSPSSWILPVSLLAGFVLTMVCVEIVDRTRPKSAVVDNFYKVVFA